MNDTLNAILRQIIIEPDVDLHRLVYADALDERGEPGDAEYAEFIRADLDGGTANPQRNKLWFDYIAPVHAPKITGWADGDRWKRGFCEGIESAAAAFLTHADSLIWHPSQTIECPECQGRKRVRLNFGLHEPTLRYGDCPRCSAKGRVTRPCPPTAQPIRKVTLTTEVAFNDYRTYFTIIGDPAREQIPAAVMEAVSPDTLGDVIFRYRFPGVEFVFLPPVGTEVISDDADYFDQGEY